MGKPKAPKAPDYAAAATAQGEANLNSALGTTYLNQQDQVTPQGSLTYNYDKANGYRLPNGTVIPHTTVTTKLSPEQQILYDQNVDISTDLNNLASRGIGFVDQAVSNPLTADAFGPRPAGPTTGTFQTPGATEYGITNGVDSPKLNSFDYKGKVPGLQDVGTISAANLNAPSYATGFDGGGPLTKGLAANARTGPIASAGGIAQSYGYNGLDPAPKVDDFSAERDRYSDLLMQRLQPYLDRQQSALDTKLANQGINLGGRAYDTAQRLNATNVNDQRIAALLAGSQEQQRNFGNALSLRQQGVGERTAEGNFYNAGQAQRYSQNANNANFNLNSSNADFQQRLAAGEFGNSAAAQEFGQNLAQAQFGNAAKSQGFQDQLAGAGLNTSIASQNIANTLAGNQQRLGAQQQAYNQAFGAAGFNRDTQQAQFNNDLSRAGFNNTAQAQQFGQGLAQSQAANEAESARFAQGLAAAQFAQGDRSQAIQEANYFQAQPLNILNALRSGNQVQNPTFGNYNAGANIAAAPVFQAAQAQGAADMAAYNAKMQAYGGLMSGLGSLGSAAIPYI